ncbi:MAG: catechol 2,3-dioxygenase-like lactoylglutathione lyase family enzyme [Parasphingorhabdus sp.]
MLIDHIGVAISDYERSKEFYLKALAPLNIGLVVEIQGWAGFGGNGKTDFWFGPDDTVQSPMHIAFVAESREKVEQFYTAAIAAGARDNGKPGVRPEYHRNYYGAFVIDPDGHNIEAVCHQEENV